MLRLLAQQGSRGTTSTATHAATSAVTSQRTGLSGARLAGSRPAGGRGGEVTARLSIREQIMAAKRQQGRTAAAAEVMTLTPAASAATSVADSCEDAQQL